MTPDRPEPICVARRTLCASPPARVVEERSSVRYSSPTSIKNCNLTETSFKSGRATSAKSFFFEKSENIFLMKASAASESSEEISEMFLPSIKTERASGLRRLPKQAGHGSKVMYLSTSARVHSDSGSFHLLSKLRATPSSLLPCFPSNNRFINFFRK